MVEFSDRLRQKLEGLIEYASESWGNRVAKMAQANLVDSTADLTLLLTQLMGVTGSQVMAKPGMSCLPAGGQLSLLCYAGSSLQVAACG